MKIKNYIVLFTIVCVNSAAFSQAPCDSLVSPCVNTVSQNGFYLELESTSNTLIESFATLTQNAGSRDVEIYHRAGSFVGFEGDPAGWTLIGSTTGFSPLDTIFCPMPETTIPIPVNYCMAANQRNSFYIMKISGTGTFEAHNAIPRGVVAATDGTLSLYSGKTSQGFYAFHPAFINDSMSFQGTIQYSCGCNPVSIKENYSSINVNAFPVPASDIINFEIANSVSELKEYRIYNITGNIVDVVKINPNEKNWTYNLAKLYSGVYSVVFFNNKNNKYARSVFVKD